MKRQTYSPRSGVYYHIFVPFFRDGNGDGVGDLRGIIQTLDYFNDGKGGGLGVKGLWLSPVHPSPSYHKYDITDFYAIDPAFGTMEDFETLVAEANKRGIGIVLDLIFNCSSHLHPWFLKAQEDASSPEAGYYYLDGSEDARYLDRDAVWNELPAWHFPEKGRGYIGIYSEVMPDFNFNSPALREECLKIARFWLKKGVSGFRLDSAMHLFSTAEVEEGVSHHAKNVAWWREFRTECRRLRPDVFLVGEVWDTPAVRALYYGGLDSSFHFYLGDSIAAFLDGKEDAAQFAKRMENSCLAASLIDPAYTDSPFLSNHDMLRYAEEHPDKDKLKQAAAIYLTMEGTPFVYYGEELGMHAAKEDTCPYFPAYDYLGRARTAFDWGEEEGMCGARFQKGYLSPSLKEQKQDRGSLYRFYERLIRLRNADRALTHGRFFPLPCPDPRVLSYALEYGAARTEVYHNAGSSPFPLPLGGDAVDLMTGEHIPTAQSRRALPPGHSAIVCYG